MTDSGSLHLLHQLLNVGSKMTFKIDINLATDTDCSNTNSPIAQGLHWGHHCGSWNFPIPVFCRSPNSSLNKSFFFSLLSISVHSPSGKSYSFKSYSLSFYSTSFVSAFHSPYTHSFTIFSGDIRSFPFPVRSMFVSLNILLVNLASLRSWNTGSLVLLYSWYSHL